MGRLPHQGAELHDGDEAAEVLHLLELILAVHHPRQVEQLGALWGVQASYTSYGFSVQERWWWGGRGLSGRAYLIHLGPEAVLEVFLGLPQHLVVLEGVQVSEHAHDAREAVHLADVEELKRLHLEAEAGVDQHQNLRGTDEYFIIQPSGRYSIQAITLSFLF